MSLLLLLVACSDPAPVKSTASTRLLAVFDDNSDGVLSQAEFERTAHPDQEFEASDLNGDQSIDASELHELLMRESPLLPNHRGGSANRSAGLPSGATPQP